MRPMSEAKDAVRTSSFGRSNRYTAECRAYRRRLSVMVLLVIVCFISMRNDGLTRSVASCATSAPAAYFPTLPPHASLPDGARCAARIPFTPETVPANTPFNRTTVTPTQLAAFAANGYTFETLASKAQYRRITGDYTGSTDMIMRWAACKYGIDENVIRGQAWEESWWEQWHTGDRRNSESQCVQGNFSALWDTTISLLDGAKVSCAGCCWTSWSAWQTKVYYEWMAWPMIRDSTSFAAEYRFASTRACIDGDWAPYFAGRRAFPGRQTYAADLASYAVNPTQANLETLLWGCVGSHSSGEWYDPAAIKYIADIQADIAHRRWLTPQIHVTGRP